MLTCRRVNTHVSRIFFKWKRTAASFKSEFVKRPSELDEDAMARLDVEGPHDAQSLLAA